MKTFQHPYFYTLNGDYRVKILEFRAVIHFFHTLFHIFKPAFVKNRVEKVEKHLCKYRQNFQEIFYNFRSAPLRIFS